jgi:hypothetical protein
MRVLDPFGETKRRDGLESRPEVVRMRIEDVIAGVQPPPHTPALMNVDAAEWGHRKRIGKYGGNQNSPTTNLAFTEDCVDGIPYSLI